MKRAKIFALSILTLFIISLFLTAVHAANTTLNNPSANSVSQTGSALFSDWKAGKLNLDVAKILFFVLIAIVLLAIVGRIPIFQDEAGKEKWYVWPVSIIGAFLATAYLAPEEIFLMLSSWGALGVTLGVVLPFVILIFFTFEEASNIDAPAPQILRSQILSYVVWILFGMVLLYRLLTVYNSTDPEVHKYISSWFMILTWVLVIVTAMIIGWIPQIYKVIENRAERETITAARRTEEEASEETIQRSQALRREGEARRRPRAPGE